MNKKIKIYLNKLNENWIVDRQRQEFIEKNNDIVTKLIYKSNLLWIIAPWTWKKVNKKYLENKKVLCTIHHIDENKLNQELSDFKNRDKFVNTYHVTNEKTATQLEDLTKKKIVVEPFWINSNNWNIINNKNQLREKYKINKKTFVIGSFQRDSEGSDLSLPKLSKGPDRLLEIVSYYSKNNDDVLVLLSGKRRDYIINELKKLKIKYLYFEMTDLSVLNELYNILDLYIVASRFEGGPQSIYECALTKTPIISTDVGVANLILSENSIFDMNNYIHAKPDIEIAHRNVQHYLIENSMKRFRTIMEDSFEN